MPCKKVRGQCVKFTVNLDRHCIDRKEQRTANIVLAIGGLNGFVSTEVQNSTFVLRIKVSAKNPAHRQYENVSVHWCDELTAKSYFDKAVSEKPNE